MKMLITILKSIFVPFSAFAFLILGLTACFCSGIIEFFVLKELLALPSGLNIDSNSWAALLVLVLEGSKFTLHFYGAALKKPNLAIAEFDVKSKQKLIATIKNALVVLSLVCSVICIVNVLYNNHDQKIEQAIVNINANCDKKLESKTKTLEKQKALQIKEDSITLKSDTDHISNLERQLEIIENKLQDEIYINKRRDLQEEAKRLRNDIRTSNDIYNQRITKIKRKAEKDYQKELKKLHSLYGPKGSERITDRTSLPPEIIRKGDNLYLSNFLLSLTRTFGKESYSRKSYFFFSISLALAISVILELCISLSQMLLTISVESFMQILGELPQIEKGKHFIQISIWLMFSMLITTSVYLISSIILHASISRENMGNAFIAYGITLILLNLLMPKSSNNGILQKIWESDSQKTSIITTLKTTLFEAFLPAALSFILFILVGIIVNQCQLVKNGLE